MPGQGRYFRKPRSAQDAKANLRKLIPRMRRRLLNSMAHTPRPRAADLERWRALEAKIEEYAAALKLAEDGDAGS